MLIQTICPACGSERADADASCPACGFVNTAPLASEEVIASWVLDSRSSDSSAARPVHCLCRLRIRGSDDPFSGRRSEPLPGLWRSVAGPWRSDP